MLFYLSIKIKVCFYKIISHSVDEVVIDINPETDINSIINPGLLLPKKLMNAFDENFRIKSKKRIRT